MAAHPSPTRQYFRNDNCAESSIIFGLRVTESLVPIRFHTSLDPYYYTVDNRPLEDINDSLLIIASAADESAGGSERSSLAAAMSGYITSGYNKFNGTFELAGTNLNLYSGFLIEEVVSSQGTIPGTEPLMSVYNYAE